MLPGTTAAPVTGLFDGLARSRMRCAASAPMPSGGTGASATGGVGEAGDAA